MTAYNLMQSSLQQGKLGSSDVETQKAKTAFLVSLTYTHLDDTDLDCHKLKVAAIFCMLMIPEHVE